MEEDRIAKIEVEGRSVNILRNIATINMDDLITEVSESGGHTLWFGHLQASADAAVEREDLKMDTLSAKLASDFRKEQARLGTKITENMVAEHLTLHPELIAAKEMLIETKRNAADLRAAYSTAQQKSRTLQNLTFLIGQETGARRDPLRDKMREDVKKGARQPV